MIELTLSEAEPAQEARIKLKVDVIHEPPKVTGERHTIARMWVDGAMVCSWAIECEQGNTAIIWNLLEVREGVGTFFLRWSLEWDTLLDRLFKQAFQTARATGNRLMGIDHGD